MRPPMLLFVCTGNICRSPMAAAIAADEAKRAHLELDVESAGTGAFGGDPATDRAREVLSSLGLSLDEHRSKPLAADAIERATLVVCATARHCASLLARFPSAAHKIRSFDELTGLGDIPDPIGADLEQYELVKDMLVRGVPRVLAALQVAQERKEK